MSNQLHPVMQQALAPYISTFLPALKVARRPKPTESFSYCLNGIQLECELDFSPAESQTYEEPGCPPDAQLCEAFHKGENIIELLSEDDKDAIETAFLEQDHDD